MSVPRRINRHESHRLINLEEADHQRLHKVQFREHKMQKYARPSHTLFRLLLPLSLIYLEAHSFYCASQMLHFVHMEGLWQVCRCHFSNSVCSLPVFRVLVILAVVQIVSLLYLSWWSVISDLWCYYCDCFGDANKDCVCPNYSTNWLLVCLSPSPQISLFPETQKYWN